MRTRSIAPNPGLLKELLGTEGEFAMIPKGLIRIDHSYQREPPKEEWVNELAANWCPPCIGTLTLARRPCKSLFAMDGQGRLAAGNKRPDVDLLPCMVFDIADVKKEALVYDELNSHRRHVPAIDRYKSWLLAKVPVALAVQRIAAGHGYTVARGAARNTVGCVDALLWGVRRSAELAEITFGICALVYDRECFPAVAYKALFLLLRHIDQQEVAPTDRAIKKVLHRGSQPLVESAMERAWSYFRNRTAIVGAQGVLDLLNKGVRKGAIPPIYTRLAGCDKEDAA